MPNFLAIEPHMFIPDYFQPTTTDHHSTSEPSSNFSAFNTAMSTIRFRRDPNNPMKLQSNARVNRWSDGSLTIQIATDPGSLHFELPPKPLAPPQIGPSKPTPTSIGGGLTNGKGGKGYNAQMDSHTYLAT